MIPPSYARADTSRAAIAAAVAGSTFIAGCTDLLQLMQARVSSPSRLLDINALPLAGVATTLDRVRIGALTRLSEVAADAAVRGRFPVIAGALEATASPQVRNMATIGGMVGGPGMALFEQAEWDPRFGRVMNANLAEYLVPVCADLGELEALFAPSEDKIFNSLGVKGVAEIAICGVAPAIANAVYHATGKRVRELPITLDRLLA